MAKEHVVGTVVSIRKRGQPWHVLTRSDGMRIHVQSFRSVVNVGDVIRFSANLVGITEAMPAYGESAFAYYNRAADLEHIKRAHVPM